MEQIIMALIFYSMGAFSFWALIYGGNPEDRNSPEVIARDCQEYSEYLLNKNKVKG